jgi:hypothetical protein
LCLNLKKNINFISGIYINYVIGDESQIDQFTNALKSCFLTEEEIKLWESGHVFQDPWPKNIVKMVS